MEIRPELLDKLKSLEIEAYVYKDSQGGVLTFRGPTWCVNPKTPLESFSDDFVTDEYGAMKDYAALPGTALASFFPDPNILDVKAFKRDKDPVDAVTLTISPDFRPLIGVNYFFGADLSNGGGDPTGLALVYYDWIQNKICMPLNIQVQTPKGVLLDVTRILQFIYELKERGFNIKKVGFDQYQSLQPILELEQHGISAEKLNYSDTFPGNKQLQELILTDKFEYYEDQQEFIGEAKHLIVVNSKRIDHPSTGPWKNRKDCWDAAVNASVLAIEDYYKNGNITQDNIQVSNLAEKLVQKNKSYGNLDLDDIRWFL